MEKSDRLLIDQALALQINLKRQIDECCTHIYNDISEAYKLSARRENLSTLQSRAYSRYLRRLLKS